MRRAQTTLTFFVVAVAIVWCAFHAVRSDQQIYNPGHLTPAHQSFEQQCWKCHDNGGNGIISQKVSDTACIGCHKSDAAIHHPNQKKLVMSVHDDPTFPGGLRSADCMKCHIEHRGVLALTALRDSNCVQCHGNLQPNAINPIVCPGSITAFATNQHPDFGRQLLKNGSYVVPTLLKYNHLFHSTQPGIGDCNSCHTTSTADKKYMQPVAFSSCAGCHQLKVQLLGGKVSLPVTHQALTLVRQEITDLPAKAAKLIAANPDRLELLYHGKKPPAANMRPAQKKAAYAKLKASSPADFYTEDELVNNGISDWQKRPVAHSQSQTLLGVLRDSTAGNASLIEDDIAFEEKTSCIECHSLSGSLPAVYEAAKLTGGKPLLLATDLTNVPRVLFVDGKFDHEKHKDEACVSCHANVYGYSIGPEHVVDADKQNRIDKPLQWDADQLRETARLLAPTAISNCTKCHNPTNNGPRPASSNCVTCHDYHDRKHEQLAVLTSK